MKIVKNAVAGTLESSDVYVQVEPNEGIEVAIESVVLVQFGDAIKASVMEVLAENEVENVKVSVNDRGAIDCTIRARVETALKRAQEV
ncbi:MAG: citrate lyase acyl carrier protein [Oscillospiraceae bacterium]|nr:citrate lyase acyl carrier protein [Oscillospiraceae bacterium]MBP1552789.1 citrate lyase acyl carrier protein [Oscillospiraceae bacterium]MBP1570917.1 citrate lyase acyl carrier protein [Oscillospiraceae bacterium]MBQ5312427.1 citrate lyase acyl carrier protein [Oscillospiraceae bacterium]